MGKKQKKARKGSIRRRIVFFFTSTALLSMLTFLPIQLGQKNQLLQSYHKDKNQSIKQLTIDNCQLKLNDFHKDIENALAGRRLSEIVYKIRNYAKTDKLVENVILLNGGDRILINTKDPKTEQSVQQKPRERFSLISKKLSTFTDENHQRIVLPVNDGSARWGTMVVYFSFEPLAKQQAAHKEMLNNRFYEIIQNSVITFGIYLIIAAVVISLLSAKISQPIEELTKRVEHFDINKFAPFEQEPLGKNDEVTVLNDAFIKLADNLQESYYKLKNHNKNLERTVAERTTELRQNNEILKLAKEDAVQANEAKSQFLASVSHEVRTPINGILGAEKLLQSTALSIKQKHFADTIASSAHNLLLTINDLLDFAKIEAGKLILENVQFDLLDTIEETLSMVSVNAYRKHVQLGIIFGPNLPKTITSDPHRIQQILTNLLTNAVKFTKDGHVKLMVSYGNELLKFAVEDTGIGISKDQQKKLFQPFVQAEASTTRRFGGTGLGLAICQSIVESMNGKIYLESEENKGTTFTFEIPIQKVEVEPKIYKEFNNEKVILSIYDNLLSKSAMSLLGHLGIKFSLLISKDVQNSIIITDDPKASFPGNNRVIRLVLPNHAHFQISEANSALILPLKRSKIIDQLKFVCGFADNVQIEQGNFLTENRPDIQILLAEDHPVNQDVFLATLEQLGFSADLADNGEIAVKRAKEKKYDIIFMDCEMPIMDGYTATRAIRGFDKEIPIVAVTAYDIASERTKAFEAGISDFVPKPISQQDIINSITRFTKEKQLEHLINSVDRHLGFENVSKGRKYLTIFVKTNRQTINQLRETDKMSEKEINECLHKIAGSAATVGLTKIAEIAGRYDHSLCQAVVRRFKEIEKIVGA